MQILFDQGTPAPLRRHLPGNNISTAFEMGWSDLENGDLLSAGEKAAFDLLITTDKNLEYQQNLTSRSIAILVLSKTSWPRIERHVSLVIDAVSKMKSGEFQRVTIPY